MRKDRVTLKTYFETGDYPSEAEFIDLIDSFLNLEDDDVVVSIIDNGNNTYTFNLLSGVTITITSSNSSGKLISLDEGNGIGYVIEGQDRTLKANIGRSSIDLGLYDPEFAAAGTDYGAGAPFSVILGDSNKISGGGYSGIIGSTNIISSTSFSNYIMGVFNKILSGYGNQCIGLYNEAATNGNGFAVLMGMNNRATGNFPAGTLGMALDIRARNQVAVGVANTLWEGGENASNRPVFVVGIGTHTTPAGPFEAILRKDGFVVNYDGTAFLPESTIAKIDAASDKHLATKEWVLANSGGGASNSIYTSNGIIPSATARLVGIPVDSSLEMVSNGPNWGSGVSIALNSISISSALVDMSTAIRNNGVSFSDTGSARLFARNGIRIRIGETEGALNSPTVGQVLTAINTDGSAEWANAPTPSKPYNSYVALLSQSGTSNPTSIVLENDMEGSIAWTRSTTGSYVGTLTGAFPLNRVVIFTGGDLVFPDATVRSRRVNNNEIRLTANVGSTAFDGVLSNTSIEVRVYS